MESQTITVSADRGLRITVTSKRTERSRSRLFRARPELASEVAAGRMSLYRALCAAGIRRRTVTVPANDLEAAMRLLGRHYSFDAIAEAAMYPPIEAQRVFAFSNGNGDPRHVSE